MHITATCRAGFEKEVAAELSDLASKNAVQAWVKTKAQSGFVELHSYEDGALREFLLKQPFSTLIFVRHWFISEAEIKFEDLNDRLASLMPAIDQDFPVRDVQVAMLDTNEGKSLSRLSKGLVTHLRTKLKNKKLMSKDAPWEAQLFLCEEGSAKIGYSPVKNKSIWDSGIPRLKLPASAPSRATLKLEEAWHQFIPAQEWEHRIAAGMRAVDLGAAPGGWTWQLVKKNMFIEAIDNGPMDPKIMETGQVTHKQEDAFTYRSSKKVHWLVCDIADKPARVASLIAGWARDNGFHEAIFNLKLPMKQRYQAVMDARAKIQKAMAATDLDYSLTFKQLYHDREEVTGHLRILGS